MGRQAVEMKVMHYLEQQRGPLAAVRASVEQLTAHRGELTRIVNDLQGTLQHVFANVSVLREVTAKIDAAIVAQEQHEVDFEAAVAVQSPRQAQLISLLAEDAAIDDVVYGLHGHRVIRLIFIRDDGSAGASTAGARAGAGHVLSSGARPGSAPVHCAGHHQPHPETTIILLLAAVSVCCDVHAVTAINQCHFSST